MRKSKCEGYEEVTSLLIGMRNYYLFADFLTRTSPKYTNLVQTRHTTHWDLARNPRSQCAGGLTVGVKNGYDEVKVQIPEEEKRESSDKSSRRIVTQRPNACSARSLRSDRVRAKAQSLRSDQTPIPLGRYVATELVLEHGRYVATGLEPKFGRYVATELFRNVDTTSVNAFSSTLRCYLPNTVANPSHVPRHF
ncbi:hypothetical protein F2Q69_00035054 [Brassica cretica]|uniref:Uncharacterized protein n=1 Tax=Brassica cretica TaxID=69181 RepID=A0A8S9SIS7_BRACR|nr:hypothetical protein F2Q69_00035054 [Brassica cretica]